MTVFGAGFALVVALGPEITFPSPPLQDLYRL
jgi:hypothetical protein